MKRAIAAIVIICLIGIFIQTASATQINVEPSHIEVAPGEEFTVNITVDPEGNETFSAQYTLYFDNTLLRAQSQNKGPFLGSDTIPVTKKIYNHLGKTEYGETRTGDTGVTEPDVLATIDFGVRGNSGTCELRLDDVILLNLSLKPIPTQANSGTLKIKDSQPSSPFLIFGHVFYENGSECLNPKVNITNLNTDKEWKAKTNTDYNYYRLMLSHGIDIIAGETLQFNVTSPDGCQSKVVSYTVNETEMNNGGLFNFNITFPPLGICGDVDGSGGVDYLDWVRLGYYTTGAPGWTIESEWAADVDCSGGVDYLDWVRLGYYTTGAPGWKLECYT